MGRSPAHKPATRAPREGRAGGLIGHACYNGHGRLARRSLPLERTPPLARWKTTMKNPLDSLWGTIIAGVILTAILYAVVKNVLN